MQGKICLLFSLGSASLSNTRHPSHSSWDQILQMKATSVFCFFFSPWSISLCLEAQWFIPWDKKKTLDVDFYFLSQDTKLFPMTSNFWSESVQLVYCQRRGKLKTKFCREVTKSTRHAFTTNVCTDRNLHGKLSTSARTHFCPSQSSIFQGLALRMHSIPTHVPGFLHVQPESPSIQHTPPWAFTH